MTDLIWVEIADERARAHEKHGVNSMESRPQFDFVRLTILMEEVDEVAREFNEAAIGARLPDAALLRKELVQVAAMAGAWADALTEHAEAGAA